MSAERCRTRFCSEMNNAMNEEGGFILHEALLDVGCIGAVTPVLR
jgi:hypothetical protein